MIKPERFLTTDEQKAIISYVGLRWNSTKDRPARYRWHLMIILMLDAGLRIAECLHLRQSDICIGRIPRDVLTVRPEIAKNHTTRVIPISTRLKIAISFVTPGLEWSRQSANDGFVFPSGSPDKPISKRAVQSMFRIIGDKAINRRLTPHMLRHTFATRLMHNSPISVVQNLLGHSSITSTQVYIHPTIEDAVTAIGKLA